MIAQPEKSAFHGKNVAILGASGFIGRWIARVMSQYDLELVHLVRDPQAFESIARRWQIRGRVESLDALDRSRIEPLLAEYRPDIVINCVGYGIDRSEKDENLAMQLNGIFPTELAARLLASDESRSVRLIHLGSALEYGRQSGDLAEDSRCRPDSLYGRTKLQGSEGILEAANRGLDAVVARLFTIYGPGEHEGRLLPSLMQAQAAGESVDLSDGAQMRDFAFVGEVARAVVALAAQKKLQYDTVNLASGRLTPVREFILTAARILQLPLDHLNFGALPRYADEMQHRPVSIDRCREVLGAGLNPDLGDGLAHAIRFEESGE